jgi:hypothetical protein
MTISTTHRVAAYVGLALFGAQSSRAQLAAQAVELHAAERVTENTPECAVGAAGGQASRRVERVCWNDVAPRCVDGRWVCETCNGTDDTGEGKADVGREDLCTSALTKRCGPGICGRTLTPTFIEDTMLPTFEITTECIFPEEEDACDDGLRCTMDSCGGEGPAQVCIHERMQDCFEPALKAIVRHWQTEEWLVVTLRDGQPSSTYDLRVQSVIPGFTSRSAVLRTDSSGNAEYRLIVPHAETRAPTCVRSFPDVRIIAVRQGAAHERAISAVSAATLVPCLIAR